MVCKFYKKPVCVGDKTCTNPSLRNTKYCPFGKTMTNKAPEACRGYAKKVSGEPHRETMPGILNSVMAGITKTVWDNGVFGAKVVVTVESDNFKARVPIVPNDSGSGWMTQKVYCRVRGNKASRALRDTIKKFKDGRNIC
jgi:hypothetical protein